MEVKMTLAQREYISRQKKRRQRIFLCRLLLFLLFLALWEFCAYTKIIDSFIFSSPSRVAACFLSMAADGSIFVHMGITIWETLLSFLIVVLAGLAAALLLWASPSVSEILDPYLVMLGSLPKSALAPILIVWLGSNMRTIIVAAVSVAIFGSILTLRDGFLRTDPEQIKLIYSLGGGRKDVLLKLLLPASVPLIISNMKVNVGLCLVGVIIGEFLAAQAGLGYLIIYGSQVFKLDMVMMSIVILCIVSAVLYQGIAVAERHFK